MEKQLWLIRHPEVEDAGSQRFYGLHDVGLSARGLEQAGKLAGFLQRRNLKRIISTGLKRTDCLARMIEQSAGIPWEVEPSLKEMHFGRWEGLSAKEAEKTDPKLYTDCVGADMDFRFPEGESIKEFMGRVKMGLEKIMLDSDDPVTAVISHSGVVRMALIDLLNLDFQDNWRQKINDTCHLT
jgi:broad specificity phosphatase PhoE